MSDALRYVDEAQLSARAKLFVRASIPSAAVIVPFAFFCSVLTRDATVPSGLINMAHVGAVVLAAGVITLGVGLVQNPPARIGCAAAMSAHRTPVPCGGLARIGPTNR